MNVQVENMVSRKGNVVPNQFKVFTKNAVLFQSYSRVIVKKRLKDGQIYLDKQYWDYSRTTGEYRRRFLGEGIATTRQKIEAGEYKLVNLNK